MADTSLKALMRDKRVQLAAAGVGGVGLVVMLMRRGGGTPAGAAKVIQPAGLDSSASDLYNGLQQLGQGWQNDLRGFTDTLGNVSDKLDKLPTGGTGKPPDTVVTPPAGPISGDVRAGWYVDQWILDMQKGYGNAGAAAKQQGKNVLWDNIFKLNPDISNNIVWNADHTRNTFKSGGNYRIA